MRLIKHAFGRAEKLRETASLAKACVALAWSANRRECSIALIAQLIAAIGAVASVFVAKAVLQSVVPSSGHSGLSTVIIPLATMAGLAALLDVAQTVLRERTRLLSEHVARRAFDRVIDAATAVDLIRFEQPAFHDRLQRARVQGQVRSLQSLQSLIGIVGGVVGGAGLLAAVAFLSPLLLPCVLVASLPLWLLSSRNARDLYGFTYEMTANDRERNYLQHLFVARESAKEIRAFDLVPFLRVRYDRLYDGRIRELRALVRRRIGRALIGSISSSFGLLAALTGLGWLYRTGHLTLAGVGAAGFGLAQLGARVRVVQNSYGSLYESMLFIRDYEEFVSMEVSPPVRQRKPRPASFARLALEDVRFKYPAAHAAALDGISLEVSAGEVIALVGENGSGKTTAAKVMAGLYRPTSGRVILDGECFGEDRQEELRDRVGLVFQDFGRYQLSARTNIGLGRHEFVHQSARVADAATRADAHSFISALPMGYGTRLGGEFAGSVDLSVGQWQRIALARAFFRDAPFVILDEPTSALDARAESELFAYIRDLLSDRAVLLISHRFSTVRTADRIYVLRSGRVIEMGSHDELIAQRGAYEEMFSLQAASYQTEIGATSS